MQPHESSCAGRHPRPLEEVLARAARLRAGPVHVLLAAASLAVAGCAAQDYVQSLTYDYTAEHRVAAERRASQDMQDACYFSGAQYPEVLGPPQVISDDGRFRATQSFYCAGTRGEGG